MVLHGAQTGRVLGAPTLGAIRSLFFCLPCRPEIVQKREVLISKGSSGQGTGLGVGPRVQKARQVELARRDLYANRGSGFLLLPRYETCRMKAPNWTRPIFSEAERGRGIECMVNEHPFHSEVLVLAARLSRGVHGPFHLRNTTWMPKTLLCVCGSPAVCCLRCTVRWIHHRPQFSPRPVW